ncbi:MAG: hypothetical protein M3280_06700 [Actinomycetota bacterium]|nr:hypothetical protein [Actinomycetota bacterium]
METTLRRHCPTAGGHVIKIEFRSVLPAIPRKKGFCELAVLSGSYLSNLFPTNRLVINYVFQDTDLDPRDTDKLCLAQRNDAA